MFDTIQLKAIKGLRNYVVQLSETQQLAIERLLGIRIVGNRLACYSDDSIDIPEFDTNQLRLVK